MQCGIDLKRHILFFFHRQRHRSQKSCLYIKNCFSAIGDRSGTHEEIEVSSTFLRDRRLISDVIEVTFPYKNSCPRSIADLYQGQTAMTL